MTYQVTLVESEEGFAVWCDDLPGCNSQGATRGKTFGSQSVSISPRNRKSKNFSALGSPAKKLTS